MKLYKALNHILFLAKDGGIKKIINHLYENIWFDLKNGTNTSTWLEKDDFEFHPENFDHGIRYRASATSEVEQALAKASEFIDIADSGFYDLGCGKGKAICIAAFKSTFDKLVGIEYYAPFLKIAAKNFDRCHVQAELEESDMSVFTDYKERSVIYMYNPADAALLRKVKENIEANTQEAVLIYNKPVHAAVFKDWDLVATKISKDPDHNTNIYTYNNRRKGTAHAQRLEQVVNDNLFTATPMPVSIPNVG